MLFDAIFVTLFVTGWAFCGLVPWLALSVWTRGAAGLPNLPLAMFAGVVGGLAVPILGRDDATGIWLSFGVAVVAPSLLLAARRFSLRAMHHPPAEGNTAK